MRLRSVLLFVPAMGLGCGSTPLVEASPCGEGAQLVSGRCVTAPSCGPGTHLEGDRCFADTPGLACGPGTVEQAGRCVAQLECGAGTLQQGTRCVPSGGTLECGPGTTQQGALCVAAPADGGIRCGPGTTLQQGSCVPSTGAGWYEIRFGATEAPADGLSKIPVLALGRTPSGLPALDGVVVALSRSTAGTLQPATLTLGPLGATTWFTPCASAGNPLCAGSVEAQLFLASAPAAPVAVSAPLMVVAPMGVGSTAPCDPHSDALFFDGQGYIFTGTQVVTVGAFSGTAGSGSPPTLVSIGVMPTLSSQGRWWTADFAAPTGQPLREQVYPMAERYPFMPPGVAGLDVTGDGRGCNRSSGRFQVHRLVVTNGQVDAFTATFEQFCEQVPTNVLRGCVKFTR
jgi:hypothetical protein